MKKLQAFACAFVITLAALCGSVKAGGLNTYDGVTYTNLLTTINNLAPAATTGAAINVTSYKGQATVVFSLSPGITNIVNYGATLQIQDSSTGTGGWTNISALVATARTNLGTVTAVKLDMSSVKNYLRAIASSTNDAVSASAVLVAY